MKCKSCVTEQHCPSGWERLSPGTKHCYRLYREKKTWHEAEQFCNGQGGHLVAVTNHEIHNYINGNNAQVWVGGTDQGTEGRWKWSDCSSWAFSQWKSFDVLEPLNPRQPNNGKDVTGVVEFGSEDCLQLRHNNDDKWHDVKCDDQQWFVCSRKLCPPPPQGNQFE